jgi:hypothetical protein
MGSLLQQKTVTTKKVMHMLHKQLLHEVVCISTKLGIPYQGREPEHLTRVHKMCTGTAGHVSGKPAKYQNSIHTLCNEKHNLKD